MKIKLVFLFIGILFISGCTGNPIKDTGCLLGVTQFVEMTGSLSANTSCFRGHSSADGSSSFAAQSSGSSFGGSDLSSGPSMTRKEQLRVCNRTAWANWVMEKNATVAEMHNALRRGLEDGPSQKATLAIKEACPPDIKDTRTVRGERLIWECKKGESECAAKEKLKAKLNEVISLSTEEGKTEIKDFLEDENKTSAAR